MDHMIWRSDAKLHYTPSAKYFKSTKPILIQSKIHVPALRRPPGPPMHRLSFGAMSAKEDRTIDSLYRLITSNKFSSRFIFCDTGFITTRMPPQFWRILSNKHASFSELTVAELSGWLSNPLANRELHYWLERAVKNCSTLPVISNQPFRESKVFGTIGNDLMPFSALIANTSSFNAKGFSHYVDMLSIRKRFGVISHRKLCSDLGREPSQSEFKQFLHSSYGPIAAPIAYKGHEIFGNRNFTADECLVVTTAINAIMTGEECLILTRDTDVFEQFTKLMHMLSADYACFRYAEMHYHEPTGCPLLPLEITHGFSKIEPYAGNSIHCIMLPQHSYDRMWPESYTPVHVYCILVGNTYLQPKVSIAAFCLETEMQEMLEVKGSSAGKNTDRFPGRNLVVGCDTNNSPNTVFALVQENYTDYEGVHASVLDIHNYLKCNPLIRRINSI